MWKTVPRRDGPSRKEGRPIQTNWPANNNTFLVLLDSSAIVTFPDPSIYDTIFYRLEQYFRLLTSLAIVLKHSKARTGFPWR